MQFKCLDWVFNKLVTNKIIIYRGNVRLLSLLVQVCLIYFETTLPFGSSYIYFTTLSLRASLYVS